MLTASFIKTEMASWLLVRHMLFRQTLPLYLLLADESYRKLGFYCCANYLCLIGFVLSFVFEKVYVSLSTAFTEIFKTHLKTDFHFLAVYCHNTYTVTVVIFPLSSYVTRKITCAVLTNKVISLRCNCVFSVLSKCSLHL